MTAAHFTAGEVRVLLAFARSSPDWAFRVGRETKSFTVHWKPVETLRARRPPVLAYTAANRERVRLTKRGREHVEWLKRLQADQAAGDPSAGDLLAKLTRYGGVL